MFLTDGHAFGQEAVVLPEVAANPSANPGENQEQFRKARVSPMGLEDHTNVIAAMPDPPGEMGAPPKRPRGSALVTGEDFIYVRIVLQGGGGIVGHEGVQCRFWEASPEGADRRCGEKEIPHIVEIDEQDPLRRSILIGLPEARQAAN